MINRGVFYASVCALIFALLTPLDVTAKEGAKGQFVDQNGNATSGTISLPDCRSCTVKQTGDHQYEIHVPKKVQDKVNNK